MLDDGTYDTVENVTNLVDSATAASSAQDLSTVTRTPSLPPRVTVPTSISAVSIGQQSTAESQRELVMDTNSQGGHGDTGVFVFVCFGF